jgi:hypothetical protein
MGIAPKINAFCRRKKGKVSNASDALSVRIFNSQLFRKATLLRLLPHQRTQLSMALYINKLPAHNAAASAPTAWPATTARQAPPVAAGGEPDDVFDAPVLPGAAELVDDDELPVGSAVIPDAVVLGVLFPKMLTQDFEDDTVTVAAKALAEVPAISAYFCLMNCTAALEVSRLK